MDRGVWRATMHGITKNWTRLSNWVHTHTQESTFWPLKVYMYHGCCLVMSDSLPPSKLQHTRLPCPSPSPRACCSSCPLSWWCHPTISSSVVPFSSCLQSLPHWGLFKWVSSSHQVAQVLELQYQSFQWIFKTDFLEHWLVWSPCSPRDPQESSLAPQFKSINSVALSLLYGSTLTSIHDHWKNYSFE